MIIELQGKIKLEEKRDSTPIADNRVGDASEEQWVAIKAGSILY
jgi:hypothetical protein